MTRLPTPDSTPVTPAPEVCRHPDDVALVRRILEGDASAWKAFVERYAGLILAMTRRYLRSRDQDDIRAVFTKVLESLKKTRLRT